MTAQRPADTAPDNLTDQELFEGLQALSDAAFPKTCSSCGRVYHSATEFATRSLAPSGRSGLKQGLDDDDQPVVELFRNCQCGSTLLDFFEDRRDNSTRGQKRREVFGKVLGNLENRGMTRTEARQELRKLMNGKPSPKLEALGPQLRVAGG